MQAVSGYIIVFSFNTKYADHYLVRIFRIKTKYKNMPADPCSGVFYGLAKDVI